MACLNRKPLKKTGICGLILYRWKTLYLLSSLLFGVEFFSWREGSFISDQEIKSSLLFGAEFFNWREGSFIIDQAIVFLRLKMAWNASAQKRQNKLPRNKTQHAKIPTRRNAFRFRFSPQLFLSERRLDQQKPEKLSQTEVYLWRPTID